MVIVDVIDVLLSQLVKVDQVSVIGNHGQIFKAIEGIILLHNKKLILDSDAKVILEVVARLFGWIAHTD